MAQLDRGAVAMIDALGVRGIWRGRDGDHDTAVLDTLAAVQKTVGGMIHYTTKALVPQKLASQFARYGHQPKVEHMALSDTIVIAASVPRSTVGSGDQNNIENLLIDLVCHCASYVLREAPQLERPLVYRGVVTRGDLVVQPPFLIGPAVDEAAELMDIADGAFVWLAPSAVPKNRRTYSPNVWESMAIPYAIPLKTGQAIDTIALSPYVDNGDRDERTRIRRGMEKAMDSTRADVVIKRQNTMKFIDYIESIQPPIIGGPQG